MSFAKVTLMGNLGRDPEMKYTPQGTPFCNFSMATSERFKKGGEQQEETTWWEVTIWGKQAETASQYLTKGRSVVIEGKPKLEKWTDRDGKERTTLRVNATDMHFVAGGGEGGGQGGGGGYQGNRGGGGQQGGGRAPGPREQARQARKQPAAGGGLSLDDNPEGTDDDTPF